MWLSKVAPLLLKVSAAIPAVGILAESLARFFVDALGISDGGPKTKKRTHRVSLVIKG